VRMKRLSGIGFAAGQSHAALTLCPVGGFF